MLMVHDQPAFVLHERPYRETSLILDLFTRDHGRVGLIAKGVRTAKPKFGRGLFRAAHELCVSWRGNGELPYVTQVEPSPGETRLATLASPMCLLYLNELLVRLLPKLDPHAKLFEHYRACLSDLRAVDASRLGWSLRRFERELLGEMGYALELACEADTRAPLRQDALYSYDPERGPVEWSRRPLPPKIGGGALRAFAGEDMPGPEIQSELKQLTRFLVRHYLNGRELNAWRLATEGQRLVHSGAY